MAIMSINIDGDIIDLISNVSELSNECKSIYTFDIKTTSNNTVSLDVSYTGGNHPYDKIEIYENGAWAEVTTFPVGVTADVDGNAKGRITIGNAEPALDTNDDLSYVCNDTEITITDTTNTVTESRLFDRCYEAPRC